MWWKKLLMDLGFALARVAVKMLSEGLRKKLVELLKQFRTEALESPERWDDIVAEGLYELANVDDGR